MEIIKQTEGSFGNSFQVVNINGVSIFPDINKISSDVEISNGPSVIPSSKKATISIVNNITGISYMPTL
jgi:hypothetical protein